MPQVQKYLKLFLLVSFHVVSNCFNFWLWWNNSQLMADYDGCGCARKASQTNHSGFHELGGPAVRPKDWRSVDTFFLGARRSRAAKLETAHCLFIYRKGWISLVNCILNANISAVFIPFGQIHKFVGSKVNFVFVFCWIDFFFVFLLGCFADQIKRKDLFLKSETIVCVPNQW